MVIFVGYSVGHRFLDNKKSFQQTAESLDSLFGDPTGIRTRVTGVRGSGPIRITPYYQGFPLASDTPQIRKNTCQSISTCISNFGGKDDLAQQDFNLNDDISKCQNITIADLSKIQKVNEKNYKKQTRLISSAKKCKKLTDEEKKIFFERQRERDREAEKFKQNERIQLNLFEKCNFDEYAAMPNIIARSALFSPIARGKRKYVKDVVIASRKGVKITFTGETFDMGDSDVFLGIIKIVDQKELGTEVEFQPYSFLKKIGRATGKANKGWLQNSIKRLKTGVLAIETKGYYVMLSLIDDYIYDKNTEKHYVKINQKMYSLFKDNQFSLIDFEKRKIMKFDLSKWLQTYLKASTGKQKISLDKLQLYCNQKRRKDRFRNDLRKCFEEMKQLKVVKKYVFHKNDIIEYETS
ncbi:MAG: hypothetical protein ABR534_04720 [Desulfotignum sp.]